MHATTGLKVLGRNPNNQSPKYMVDYQLDYYAIS